MDHVQTLLILGTQKAVDAFRKSGRSGTLVLVRLLVRSSVASHRHFYITCLNPGSEHQQGAVMQSDTCHESFTQGTDFTVAAMAGGDLGLGSSESSNPFLDRDAISLSLSDGAMLDLSLAGEQSSPSLRATCEAGGGSLAFGMEHRWSCSLDASLCARRLDLCRK